jgi:hypothetical protein
LNGRRQLEVVAILKTNWMVRVYFELHIASEVHTSGVHASEVHISEVHDSEVLRAGESCAGASAIEWDAATSPRQAFKRVINSSRSPTDAHSSPTSPKLASSRNEANRRRSSAHGGLSNLSIARTAMAFHRSPCSRATNSLTPSSAPCRLSGAPTPTPPYLDDNGARVPHPQDAC